jgi:hypothetical protein
VVVSTSPTTLCRDDIRSIEVSPDFAVVLP